MSQSGQTPNQNRITDLKVSGHLMTLDQGLFCVFHAPSQEAPSASGLPGVRLTPPPIATGDVAISTFDSSGWLGGANNGALVRVTRGPAQVLVTIYQEPNSPHEAPRLQVVKLSEAAGSPAENMAAPSLPNTTLPQPQPQPPLQPAAATEAPEIGAHIQRRGDVGARIGEWMGTPGSRAWIEGFGISPDHMIAPTDIEYQAVLGKGWLSPWAQGGQYCGSRGMALPILGLRVRLKGEAADVYECFVEASFTDGTKIGPVDGTTEAAEAESLAPLEAFRIIIKSRAEEEAEQFTQDIEDEIEDDLALLEAASGRVTRAPSPASTPARSGRLKPKSRMTTDAPARTSFVSTPKSAPAPAKRGGRSMTAAPVAPKAKAKTAVAPKAVKATSASPRASVKKAPAPSRASLKQPARSQPKGRRR